MRVNIVKIERRFEIRISADGGNTFTVVMPMGTATEADKATAIATFDNAHGNSPEYASLETEIGDVTNTADFGQRYQLEIRAERFERRRIS